MSRAGRRSLRGAAPGTVCARRREGEGAQLGCLRLGGTGNAGSAAGGAPWCRARARAEWEPPADRPDPIAVLDAENAGRIPDLVPVRWGRMLESPFAFMRGAAGLMAADLARTPSTGLHVQLCGDAHMANFGVFASPERRLLFDVNDFDETTPGPWEWDLKRLAASAVVIGRVSGIAPEHQAEAAHAVARAYRRHMARFAGMGVLEVWYERVDAKAALRTIGRRAPPGALRRGRGASPDLAGGAAQAHGAHRRGPSDGSSITRRS